MPRFRITQLSDAGQVEHETAADFSAQALAGFFEWAHHAYGDKIDTGEREAVPEDAPEGTVGAPIMRDPTDQEVFERWAGGITKGTIANIERYFEDKIKAQMPQVPKIEFVKV